MATHPLQSTGQISMNDINLELGRASGSQISLDTAENNGYGTINSLSASRPSATNPATLSEWYGYNHLATDTTAPSKVFNLTSSDIISTSCTLTWNASSDNVGVTNYLVYRNSVLYLTVGNVLTTPITGLTASTTYDFSVSARDAAGNEGAQSGLLSVTTSSANTPPTTPTTFTVTRGTLQATIAWSGATDNVAVTNYEIHRSLNGTTYSFLTYDTASPYVNTGLTSGSTYWYKVRSIDGGGLMSAFTTPKSVTII